jgi:hypothetical protein
MQCLTENGRGKEMLGVVICGKSAWIVDNDCPCSFEFKGGYYVWDKDYLKAKNYYVEKENK